MKTVCCLGGFLCQLLIIGQAIVLYIIKGSSHDAFSPQSLMRRFVQYRRSHELRQPLDLSLIHIFQAKVPTEILITDRREYELAEQGFITLTMRKGSDNAAFFLSLIHI